MSASEPFLVAGHPDESAHRDGDTTAARFEYPNAVIIGRDGGLIVADTGNSRIRNVQSGQVTTLAGSGRQSRVDSEKAQDAAFQSPDCVAVLPSGSYLVGDSSRVRQIHPDGSVSTWLDLLAEVEGSPAHVTDILIDDQTVYVLDRINRRVYRRTNGTPHTLFAVTEDEPHSIAKRPNGDIIIGVRERILGVRSDGFKYVLHQGDVASEEPLSDLIVGMVYDRMGRLVVADAYCGLLMLSPEGKFTQLWEGHSGVLSICLGDTDRIVYCTSGHAIWKIELPE